MTEQSELKRQAQNLPMAERESRLLSLKETELHSYLKELFGRMDPHSLIEITHGADEFGKDLVMVRDDPFERRVIGIIVKIGDIRAKTLKKVDEIMSQCNQAFSNPAQLKSINDRLPVSTVWVVLAGKISRQAHQRIETEVRFHNVKIYDLQWLVDNFTEFYPQVFFEGHVMDYLQEKIQELEARHLFCTRGVNLSDCFVDPVVSTIDIPVTFDEEQISLTIRDRKMPFSHLSSLVKKHRRLLLSGAPGTGKSVALAKLTLDMLKKAAKQLARGKNIALELPVLITANDLLIYDSHEDLMLQLIPYPEDVRNRFQITSLMVDALDEVLPADRERAMTRACQFADQLSCSLVISSRKIDLIKATPSGFNKYELLPFEFGQAMKLFQKLINDSLVLETLKDGLNRIQYQIDLTPLSLHLLIELAENHREIPASVTELYDRYCDQTLGRYDRDKGIEVLFEYLIKKRFLAKLAFEEFFEKNRLSILKKDFEGFVKEHAGVYGWDEESLHLFIRDVERAGVLEFQDTVDFCHRSFLDYFVAQYIFDNREEFEDLDRNIVEIYFDDVWTDVAFYYVGLRREIRTSILELIFSATDDNPTIQIHKLLAGRLLQAAWHATQSTKLYGIKRSVAYALPVRNILLSIAKQPKSSFPEIFADFFAMMLADVSLSSGFLSEETDIVLDSLQTEPTLENLYMMIAILWATQRFYTQTGLRDKSNDILTLMSKIESLSIRDESIALIWLDIIEKDDKSIRRTIRKRLGKLSKKYPQIFSAILPSRSRRKKRTKS